jgi:predicted lipoprotein
MNIKETISIISIILLLISCSKDSDIEYDTAFNNQEMLSDITNQLIIPSIINLNTSCIELNNSVENYIQNTNENNLIQIQDKWKEAAKNYAKIYAFNIGEAKDQFFNKKLYNWPTVGNSIEQYIIEQDEIIQENIPNLSTKYMTLSGIGYMLFSSSNLIVNQNFVSSTKRLDYLKYISIFQKEQSQELLDLWTESGSNYGNTLIYSSDTNVNSSLNKIYNGVYNVICSVKVTKIGKSAGLENSSNPNIDELQAKYSEYSKELIIENLKTSKNIFFNEQGFGLSDKISSITGNEELNDLLRLKFDSTINLLNNFEGSLKNAITNGNISDLEIIHEQLNEIITLLVIDVRSTLSIVITPCDNDGD